MILEDIDFSKYYNPFFDFLNKCFFFEEKLEILDLFFEELVNVCTIAIQINREMMVNFFINTNTLEKFIEMTLAKGKKSWIISMLKLFKELILIKEERVFHIITKESIKKKFYKIFLKHFSAKNNIINSLFLEIFLVIIKQKNYNILVKIKKSLVFII